MVYKHDTKYINFSFHHFSASWNEKYTSFLDQLEPKNARQTLRSLTNQLKIFYLQH